MRRKQGALYALAGKKILAINKLITELAPKLADESLNHEDDQQVIPTEVVTLNHFEEGIFPWEPASLSTPSKSFNLN